MPQSSRILPVLYSTHVSQYAFSVTPPEEPLLRDPTFRSTVKYIPFACLRTGVPRGSPVRARPYVRSRMSLSTTDLRNGRYPLHMF